MKKPPSTRQLKMNELIQQKLGTLILREVQDPRLQMVTISGVEVSKDMSFAKVYFSMIDAEHTLDEVMAALKNASGFLRHHLAQTLDTRIVPVLHFNHDISFERADYLNRLIQKAREKDAQIMGSQVVSDSEDDIENSENDSEE